MNVAEAYAECRATAQREAKNFYYAFRALPQHKSDAMCAVYAFMRKADDLADDESVPLEERRRRMSEWTENWRRARGGETDDPVFLALNDTQKRFGISDELLEKLVEGTTLDLNPQPPGTQITVCYTSATTVENVQAYLDQEALYDYCYLVASVVGLVCIRIFGYSDPAAEKLAEDTGIAFQLTNILRDVNEDLSRNRCYLPLMMLRAFAQHPEHYLRVARGIEQATKTDREMIKMFAEDALAFYRSAEKLIPLIDADSRAALWVLVRIYFELLNTIYKADGDVFTVRRSVSDKRKAWILVQGMLRARWYQWRG
jgi:phytoene synthase